MKTIVLLFFLFLLMMMLRGLGRIDYCTRPIRMLEQFRRIFLSRHLNFGGLGRDSSVKLCAGSRKQK